MVVLIYGAGSVGCMVGAFLSAGGCRVTLLGRPSLMDPIRQEGLTLRWQGRVWHTEPYVACTLEEAFSYGRPDLIILTVKAYDTHAAVEDIIRLFPRGEGCPILLTLQNGIGNEEAIAGYIGTEKTLSGTTTLAASLPAPAEVAVHTDRGGVALAHLTDQTLASEGRQKEVATQFILSRLSLSLRGVGVPVLIEQDYRAVKWSKLLLNILGNSTSAILDMTPGTALVDHRVYRLEVAAFREACQVMRAYGIRIIDLPGYPVRLLAAILRFTPPRLSYGLLYQRIAGGRGDKPPSLLLDLRRGRKVTEISFLNGAVASWGAEKGVPTPVNSGLTRLVEGISSGRIDWDLFRGNPQALIRAINQQL